MALERCKPKQPCIKCGNAEDQEDMVSCVSCKDGPWHFDCLEGGSAGGKDNYKCKKCMPGTQLVLLAILICKMSHSNRLTYPR